MGILVDWQILGLFVTDKTTVFLPPLATCTNVQKTVKTKKVFTFVFLACKVSNFANKLSIPLVILIFVDQQCVNNQHSVMCQCDQHLNNLNFNDQCTPPRVGPFNHRFIILCALMSKIMSFEDACLNHNVSLSYEFKNYNHHETLKVHFATSLRLFNYFKVYVLLH